MDATRSMDHIIMCMRASFGRVALLPFRVSERMQPGAERSRMRQFAVHFPARISCLAIGLRHTKEFVHCVARCTPCSFTRDLFNLLSYHPEVNTHHAPNSPAREAASALSELAPSEFTLCHDRSASVSPDGGKAIDSDQENSEEDVTPLRA